jgi:hypothetical protein
MRTKNHILTLLENGLSFNTISGLNDNQIKVLSEKFSKKEENKEAQDIQTKIRRFSSSEVSNAKTKGESLPGGRAFKLNADGSVDVTLEGEMSEDDTVDFVNDPDATEDGMGMFESEMKEKFESKAQQGLFWSKCKSSTGKTKEKWCKMAKEFSDSTSKKDYKKMPDKKHPKKTNENLERFLEDKILDILDEHINPTFTKGNMLKTISEKSNKFNSMILKNPKKMSMFSDESGIEMKRMKKPISNIFSLGEDTKEKERTREKDRTKEKDRKKDNPFRDPNPGVEEQPKAGTKEKERTKEREKTKTPTRRKGNPFRDPNPDVEEKPKAKMEKQQSNFIDAIMNVLNF